jgi:hypothetical protein
MDRIIDDAVRKPSGEKDGEMGLFLAPRSGHVLAGTADSRTNPWGRSVNRSEALAVFEVARSKRNTALLADTDYPMLSRELAEVNGILARLYHPGSHCIT